LDTNEDEKQKSDKEKTKKKRGVFGFLKK